MVQASLVDHLFMDLPSRLARFLLLLLLLILLTIAWIVVISSLINYTWYVFYLLFFWRHATYKLISSIQCVLAQATMNFIFKNTIYNFPSKLI